MKSGTKCHFKSCFTGREIFQAGLNKMNKVFLRPLMVVLAAGLMMWLGGCKSTEKTVKEEVIKVSNIDRAGKEEVKEAVKEEKIKVDDTQGKGYGWYGDVLGDRVRVRSCPEISTNCKTLDYVNKGDVVQVLDRGGKEYKGKLWYKVKLADGTVGWVYEEYVNRNPDVKVSVKIDRPITKENFKYKGKEIRLKNELGEFTYSIGKDGKMYIDTLKSDRYEDIGGLLFFNEEGNINRVIYGDAYISPDKSYIIKVERDNDDAKILILDREGKVKREIISPFYYWKIKFLNNGNTFLLINPWNDDGTIGACFYTRDGKLLNPDNYTNLNFQQSVISGDGKVLCAHIAYEISDNPIKYYVEATFYNSEGKEIDNIPNETLNEMGVVADNSFIAGINYADLSYDGKYYIIVGSDRIVSFKYENGKYKKMWEKNKKIDGFRGFQVKISKDGEYVVCDNGIYDNYTGQLITKIDLNKKSYFYNKYRDEFDKLKYKVRIDFVANDTEYLIRNWNGVFLFTDNYIIITRNWHKEWGNEYPYHNKYYTEVYIYDYTGEYQGYTIIEDFEVIDGKEAEKDNIILEGRYSIVTLDIRGIVNE